MGTSVTLQSVHFKTLLRHRGEIARNGDGGGVLYSSGDQTFASVDCVVTRPGESQADVDEYSTLESRQWDFLFDPDALLTPGGQRYVPEAGDRITRYRRDPDGNLVVDSTYTVEPAAASQVHWRWSDNLETFRRVHATADKSK